MSERADRLEQRGNAWVVLSKAGEELDRFTGPDAREKAGERLRQIEAAKFARGDGFSEDASRLDAMQVGAARDLPIIDVAWDAAGARDRVFEWAGFDNENPDPARARMAFLAYDASSPDAKASYRLPFADIDESGKLVANIRALRNAAARLNQTNIPAAVRDRARTIITNYLDIAKAAREEEAKAKAEEPRDDSLQVRRYDRGTITRRPYRDDSTGALIARASITRAPAVFTYRNRDGSIRREFRPAEHVFSEDNLGRMGRSPVTLGHPKERVTTKNMKRLSVGQAVGNIEVQAKHAIVDISVNDEEGIEALDRGVTDTSCGYDCDLVMTPGVFVDDDGRTYPYDAVQTNHRNNHIALCHEGRAGTTRVMMDSLDRLDAYQIGDDEMSQVETRREDLMTQSGNKGRVRLDGVEVELDITTATRVADALAKADNEAKAARDDAEEAKAKLDALEAERDEANAKLTETKAKHDALEAERDELKVKLDEAEKAKPDEAKIRELVEARRAFDDKAMAHFDSKEWEDLKAKPEIEIMKAAVAKARPNLNLDEKSDEYIVAAYEIVEPPSRSDANELAAAAVNAGSRDPKDHRTEVQARLDAAINQTANSWKKPVIGGMTTDGKTTSTQANA